MASASSEPTRRPAAGTFYKRTYRGPGELLRDILFMLRNSRRVRRTMRSGLVPPAFRERMMLAVTSVYGCRYCSWAHTREALRSGIDREEAARLLAGTFDGCPEDEAAAVLYAQHWADSDARPDPEAVERLERTYGADKAEAIEVVLRMIRVGNLSGNTWDRFLSFISLGRLGKATQTPRA